VQEVNSVSHALCTSGRSIHVSVCCVRMPIGQVGNIIPPVTDPVAVQVYYLLKLFEPVRVIV
jgi:hypothetical protein